MNYEKFTKCVLAVIATVAIGFSGAAIADEADGLKGRSVKVVYEDLNLEKEPGARALYRRLQHASNAACGVEASRKARMVRGKSESQRCYREVLTASVKRVDSELVTRIHEST